MLSSNDLLAQAKKYGVESAVTVNHRMLIDKILARYSSDFVVCRELIQNADDARATSFCLELTCEVNAPTQKTFHNSVINEIRAVNNGAPFTVEDWQRVASIAEGNTSVESVGQFGVGFFSVFSFSDEPIIKSGKECMIFTWKNNNSLTTYRRTLPNCEVSRSTSVILKLRHRYVLSTEATLTEQGKQSQSNLSAIEIETVTQKSAVIPTLDLYQLKAYFTKGICQRSFRRHLKPTS